VLPSNVTAEGVAAGLRAWAEDAEGWRRRAASTAARLQLRSWDDMASEIVALATGAAPDAAAGINPLRVNQR
jgi:hypothetical protein